MFWVMIGYDNHGFVLNYSLLVKNTSETEHFEGFVCLGLHYGVSGG